MFIFGVKIGNWITFKREVRLISKRCLLRVSKDKEALSASSMHVYWTYIHIYLYIYGHVATSVQLLIHTRKGEQLLRPEKHGVKWKQSHDLQAALSMRDATSYVQETCLKRETDKSWKWEEKGIIKNRLTLIIFLCMCSALCCCLRGTEAQSLHNCSRLWVSSQVPRDLHQLLCALPSTLVMHLTLLNNQEP